MKKIWLIVFDDASGIVTFAESAKEAYDKILLDIKLSYANALDDDDRDIRDYHEELIESYEKELKESYDKNPENFHGFIYQVYVVEKINPPF